MKNTDDKKMPSEPVQVAALYHFAVVDDPAALRSEILEQCEKKHLKGTILLAPEGINGTIAGDAEAIDSMIVYLTALPQFPGLEVKYSSAFEMPFLRMKVRLKKEIVSMGVDGIDAARAQGNYVDPQDWNAVVADPDTIVIDTRNAYEVAIGSFDGAINPAISPHGLMPLPKICRQKRINNPRLRCSALAALDAKRPLPM